MLIQRAAVGHVIQPPTLVEEHIACDDNASLFMKQCEDLDIAETQIDRGSAATGSQFGWEDLEVCKAKRRGKCRCGIRGKAPSCYGSSSRPLSVCSHPRHNADALDQ